MFALFGIAVGVVLVAALAAEEGNAASFHSIHVSAVVGAIAWLLLFLVRGHRP